MKKILNVLAVFAVVGLLAIQPAARAQERIKVLSDVPLRPALVNIGEAFRQDSGYQVEFTFGVSPVVHKKVVEGEPADVLIIQPNYIAELAKSGKVVSGKHPIIGRVGIGLAIRSDGPALDISTTDKLRAVLLSVDSLTFNNVASGDTFARALDRLNIAEAVKAKTVRVERGLVARILQGKGTDLGALPITVILANKGLKLVGPLPLELQEYLVYTAAPMTGSQSPKAGNDFIRYLTSAAAKAAFIATGVE